MSVIRALRNRAKLALGHVERALDPKCASPIYFFGDPQVVGLLRNEIAQHAEKQPTKEGTHEQEKGQQA